MSNFRDCFIQARDKSLDNIQNICRSLLPSDIKNCPWTITDKGGHLGVTIYDDETQLNAYMAAYIQWHKGKLFHIFENLPLGALNGDISIIDWGCGQGMASLCLYEYAKKHNLKTKVHEIILIEPSEIALDRAEFILSNIDTKANISKINCKLDEVNENDIKLFNNHKVIHLFSNILDIQGINLKHLSEILFTNSESDNYVLCVSPYYPSSGNRRIDAFLKYFSNDLSFFYQDEKSLQEKQNRSDYTFYIKAFRLDANLLNQIRRFRYFPAAQFACGYSLDCIFDLVEHTEDCNFSNLPFFSVYAPFDIGTSISDDVHPIYAVLNNIISRGLPTKASPFIEETFASAFGFSDFDNSFGSIKFTNKLSKNVANEIIAILKEPNRFSSNTIANQLVFTPIAIARFHKTIIEALIAEKLDINSQEWNILVQENDVPFAALAVKDLENLFNNLTALSADFDNLRLPKINLDIIANNRYADSKLHLSHPIYVETDSSIKSKRYDLVVKYSSLYKNGENNFTEFQVKNDCYFAIYALDNCKINRIVYTTDKIYYKPLTTRNNQGTYNNIEENVAHLRYFLNLLFRKQDFRNGQLPILSRAIQNKSVIGLLPTGGGKSLTYQLAAMIQPGITIVIDPLVSLMKDQYDGLLKAKIDICTYVNSQVENKAANEFLMERSRVLFVFMSPERLCIYKFRSRLKNMQALKVYFAYGVIDEVHCVSEWGHDFRFSYLHLGRNLYQYVLPKQTDDREQHISLFGLTATASFDVLADVERELSDNGAFPLDSDAVVRYENTNRLELQYRVQEIDGTECMTKWDVFRKKNETIPNVIEESIDYFNELQSEESINNIKSRFIERENINENDELYSQIINADIRTQISDDWYNQDNEAGAIVFCPHRQGSLGVYDTSSNSGVSSCLRTFVNPRRISSFVGGDDLAPQTQFIAGESNIMVATKAFGMGIDKPNVRFTLNINHSGSLEAFVQEAGRAGRDRKMALATVLYCPKAFNEQNERTRLMESVPVDYGVHQFFYDNSFIGEDFEKWVMFFLMTKNFAQVSDEEYTTEHQSHFNSVSGFLESLLDAEPGTPMTYYFSYDIRDNEDVVAINDIFMKKRWPIFETPENARMQYAYGKVDYTASLSKAIYRMCCVGIIDDYTQDYVNQKFRIVATRKPDGGYFEALKTFLIRYYSAKRAELEMENAYNFKGDNEIQKCLGYITDFVYSKIATKRKRAIKDIEDFCYSAITSNDHWLEVNEQLKDHIYYYFNSKFAREGYSIDSGEPFSLTDDTDRGRISSFDILFKYLRIIDDDVVGSSGSPKDNIKHLQGAVRLIRRALTEANPALDLLNVFCLFSLKVNDNQNLFEELKQSFINGYCEFRKRSESMTAFYSNIKKFVDILTNKNAISNEDLTLIKQWELLCEVSIQNDWLTNFKNKYTKQ